MGSAASRNATDDREAKQEKEGRMMRRKLLGLMQPTTGAATPSMRRALDSSYRSCRQSIEAGLRLGSGNAWSRRWRPFVEKYGPASAGYQAASVDGTEMYTQLVRMFEECQAMKIKYGYQQYQFVRSEQYPHAMPVRFASPLSHQKLPLLAPDLDNDDNDFYRRASHWKRHDLWRQMQQSRVIPVTPPSVEELRQDRTDSLPADSPLHKYGIDQVQEPLPHQNETSTQTTDPRLAGADDSHDYNQGATVDVPPKTTTVPPGKKQSGPSLRRLPLPDKIAAQQALHSP